MSFNRELAKVKNESLPVGSRYTSLRHCGDLSAPFGFQKTWAVMEHKFGLKEGLLNSHEVFMQCAGFLEADRDAWKALTEAQENMARTRASFGLPKPGFSCKQNSGQ